MFLLRQHIFGLEIWYAELRIPWQGYLNLFCGSIEDIQLPTQSPPGLISPCSTLSLDHELLDLSQVHHHDGDP
jgi:hypothetical protein